MQAMLWSQEGDKVHCELCAHGCKLPEGACGACGVRVNVHGKLVSLVKDIVTALNMDPVEKKPLYHFLPGTKTFSIGGAGCNFRCFFCQNYEIAHVNKDSVLPGRRLTPETLARLADQNKARSVAFTYNEPAIFFEQSYNMAGLVRAQGIKTVLVSNGYMSPAYLQSMGKRIDAANIDLKSFSDEFYKKFCRGRLQPVLDNLKRIKDMDWWLEVTTLIIPGINDSPEEVGKAAEFIKTELGPDTPWHLSGFHGAAHMANHPSTPAYRLEEAYKIGTQAGLRYVYLGNTQSPVGNDTYCPGCGTVLIERRGYRTGRRMRNGVCPTCHMEIPGVWS